jgi:hypothetical protein
MGFVVSIGAEPRTRRWVARLRAITAAGALLSASGVLTGCSSVSHVVADHWPRALGGLPEGVPPRQENPPEYMSVNEAPPTRDTKKLTPQERAKYEAEMAASRTQNTTEGQQTQTQSPSRLPPIR